MTIVVESMYNNMTDDLARVASGEYLDGVSNEDQESRGVRTESLGSN